MRNVWQAMSRDHSEAIPIALPRTRLMGFAFALPILRTVICSSWRWSLHSIDHLSFPSGKAVTVAGHGFDGRGERTELLPQ